MLAYSVPITFMSWPHTTASWTISLLWDIFQLKIFEQILLIGLPLSFLDACHAGDLLAVVEEKGHICSRRTASATV
jgi:hypothetical protein